MPEPINAAQVVLENALELARDTFLDAAQRGDIAAMDALFHVLSMAIVDAETHGVEFVGFKADDLDPVRLMAQAKRLR